MNNKKLNWSYPFDMFDIFFISLLTIIGAASLTFGLNLKQAIIFSLFSILAYISIAYGGIMIGRFARKRREIKND